MAPSTLRVGPGHRSCACRYCRRILVYVGHHSRLASRAPMERMHSSAQGLTARFPGLRG
jgi:hypothetical protein